MKIIPIKESHQYWPNSIFYQLNKVKDKNILSSSSINEIYMQTRKLWEHSDNMNVALERWHTDNYKQPL